MTGYLRALIGAACLVIITGGAFAAWGAYANYRDDQMQRQLLADAEAELFELAKAEPGEDAKVRYFCRQIGEAIEQRPNAQAHGDWQILQTNCRILGFA